MVFLLIGRALLKPFYIFDIGKTNGVLQFSKLQGHNRWRILWRKYYTGSVCYR